MQTTPPCNTQDSIETGGSASTSFLREVDRCEQELKKFIERQRDGTNHTQDQINATRTQIDRCLGSIAKNMKDARNDLSQKMNSGISQRVNLASDEAKKINQHLANIDALIQQTGMVHEAYQDMREKR